MKAFPVMIILKSSWRDVSNEKIQDVFTLESGWIYVNRKPDALVQPDQILVFKFCVIAHTNAM